MSTKRSKYKGRHFRGRVDDVHNETCMCRRCRARYDAIERKDLRLDTIRNMDDINEIIKYRDDQLC